MQMGEDWAGPPKRVLELARILHRRGIGWLPGLRADQIDEEFAQQIAELGCTGVAIGIESGSPRILKDIVNKKETVEQFLTAANALAKAKLKPQYYFIVGFPGEASEDRRKTYDFADKLYQIHKGNLTTIFYSFTPLPGTPLGERAAEIGVELPRNLDGWSNYSLNRSYSQEYANIYLIAGLTFHRGKGDKTDRNFPGLSRWLIRPLELACVLRWKLRFWRFFGLERWLIEALLRWASARRRRRSAGA